MKSIFIKSTETIIKVIDKIFASRIVVKNEHNIPKNPTLFVANHFTRSETFILPYILYKLNNKHIRSLADNNIFVGMFGKYLKSMGTISTTNPNRNNIILKDLITGKNDWLIYPEGIMVKNKNITKNKNYIIHKNNNLYRVRTGAATLALKAELIKREFSQIKKQEDLFELKNKYNLAKRSRISEQKLSVVPIAINYYPIRTGKNKFLNLAKRFLKKIPNRVLEELEIEGNILDRSDIIINFGEAIDISDYVDKSYNLAKKIPLFSDEKKLDMLINHHRFKLTNFFMQKIYYDIELNIDHFFSFILLNYAKKHINRDTLKKLIFISSFETRKLDIDFHKSLNTGLISMWSKKKSYFSDILSFAEEQKILIKEGDDCYMINKEKLKGDEFSFHQIRLHNCLQIFINELNVFPITSKIIKKNSKLSAKQIDRIFFKYLLENDQEEFLLDYKKYFSQEFSKEKNIGRPFLLESKKPTNVGIILSHGYKSAPKEVEVLAKYLHKAGYNIYAPRLKGHGTAPHNLKDVKWQDWYDSYYKGYLLLKSLGCKKIIATGFSTGGLLALLTTANEELDISGIISINSAIKLNDIRVNFAGSMNFWNEFLGKINLANYKKEFVEDNSENPKINYQRNYIKGVEELAKLMKETDKNLHKITVPTLIIQGKNDPVVNPKSADIIFDKILSKEKKKIMPDFDKHIIIKEKDNALFAQIVEFIEGLLDQNR